MGCGFFKTNLLHKLIVSLFCLIKKGNSLQFNTDDALNFGFLAN